MDIYGLGSLAMDVLMKVDRLPGPDSFCVIKSTEVQPGGSGTNVMVQCARLGAECGFIGCVGDAFGVLAEENVNADKILGSKVFYTDLLPPAPAVSMLKKAKEAGIKTVFNMQVGLSTMGGFGIDAQGVLDILKYVDVFAPCQEGLMDLTGTTDVDECRKTLRKYTNAILLFTQGKKGSVGYDEEDREYHADIYPVQAVDTTGAGDSYIGAFMVGYYVRNYDLAKAMRFASACSAYTCTGIGARFSPDSRKADEIFGE